MTTEVYEKGFFKELGLFPVKEILNEKAPNYSIKRARDFFEKNFSLKTEKGRREINEILKETSQIISEKFENLYASLKEINYAIIMADNDQALIQNLSKLQEDADEITLKHVKKAVRKIKNFEKTKQGIKEAKDDLGKVTNQAEKKILGAKKTFKEKEKILRQNFKLD